MNIEQAKQIPMEDAMHRLGLSPTRVRGTRPGITVRFATNPMHPSR